MYSEAACFYMIGNCIPHHVKTSGRMRTAAYNNDVASDCRRREDVPMHIPLNAHYNAYLKE